MIDKLRQLIREGERLTVELKRCRNKITNNIYETVSAFSNRYGGYILLGVGDDGEVSGVNPAAVDKIKKDFVTISKESSACELLHQHWASRRTWLRRQKLV